MQNKSIQLISKVKEIYAQGGNIIKFLKKENKRTQNTLEEILISYDFQSGSYIDYVTKNPLYIKEYTEELSSIIKNIGVSNTILEVGVGECTTLANIISELKQKNTIYFGFDISWSRIHYGKRYLASKKHKANLFVADLFNIPLPSDSIDIVYTSHSIEPNGGREKEALIELLRITKKYLILLEPTAEFASNEGIKRMKENGYIQNLKSIILELGLDLIEYKKFKICSNELNPTGLYVIKKHSDKEVKNNPDFICPISKSPMEEFDDHFFCEDSFISYPKINNTPCLLDSYGILTTKHNY